MIRVLLLSALRRITELKRPPLDQAANAEALNSVDDCNVTGAEPFLGACRDVRKAWFSTNVLARCNPSRITAAREALIAGDEAVIVALMADMAGPTATPNLHEAFGPAALRHLETASIVARLIVKEALSVRSNGMPLDMEAVKFGMVKWIESGTGNRELSTSSKSLESISALVIESAPAGDGVRARLALMAPFAVSIETLIVVAGLSQSLIDVLLRTWRETSKNKVTADAWMRAHPDFVRQKFRCDPTLRNPMNISRLSQDQLLELAKKSIPEAHGDGKPWQERAFSLWSAVTRTLCHRRDAHGADLSVATIVDYLALPRIEELYIKGYEEFLEQGHWNEGYAGIKAYLETSCPAYSVDKLLAKFGHISVPPSPSLGGMFETEQSPVCLEQHSYLTMQLMPILRDLETSS